jgi:hypothetical protein
MRRVLFVETDPEKLFVVSRRGKGERLFQALRVKLDVLRVMEKDDKRTRRDVLLFTAPVVALCGTLLNVTDIMNFEVSPISKRSVRKRGVWSPVVYNAQRRVLTPSDLLFWKSGATVDEWDLALPLRTFCADQQKEMLFELAMEELRRFEDTCHWAPGGQERRALLGLTNDEIVAAKTKMVEMVERVRQWTSLS